MINWKIHHKAKTVSTNLDAREGRPGDVFTADYQTAGRGRLDHKWLSPPRTNLMMSVVMSVEGLSPECVATLPLVVGLAVSKGLSPFARGLTPRLKWPNDVLIEGRKVAGILCERVGDRVIAGIGVNVKKQVFAEEIADKATSLGNLEGTVSISEGVSPTIPAVREAVLMALAKAYDLWRIGGFAVIYPEVRAIDVLRGQSLSVRQSDDDSQPVRGICGGINEDGSLTVGRVKIYAGEAHVEKIG